MARVPLIPTSQSLSLRQTAASARGAISSPARSAANPSRIASAVMLCSQRRRVGFLLPGKLQEVMKNQFAFAAGITGVDDFVDVGALEQPLDQVESRLGFFDRLEIEMIRNDRKIGEAPLAALLVHLAGQTELDQVADGGSDHEIIILEDVVLLGNFAESASEVGRDTRLFSDDESFWHLIGFSQSDYRAIA